MSGFGNSSDSHHIYVVGKEYSLPDVADEVPGFFNGAIEYVPDSAIFALSEINLRDISPTPAPLDFYEEERDYIEEMIRDFDQTPPVVWSRPSLCLLDGWHRAAVALHLKRERIRAFVTESSIIPFDRGLYQ